MRALGLLALTGCAQVFGLEPPTRLALTDSSVSDGSAPDSTGSTGDAPASITACDPVDPTLIACFDFENNVNDAKANLDTTPTSITYGPGLLGNAVRMSATSKISVAEDMALAADVVTMQAWIRPTELPSTARMGVWDADGRYALFVTESGAVRCQTSVSTSAGRILSKEWTHVACTVDGNQVVIYINGVVLAMGVDGPLGGGFGAAIGGNAPEGDPFIGDIDLLRLYRVVRTREQICSDAGGCD